jgi:hypothetical protein
MRGQAFPSVFARASLKRGSWRGSARPSARIPERFCSGLIEAGLDQRREAARRGGIPERFCSGLIEASSRGLCRGSTSRIPERFCSGLIEATRRKMVSAKEYSSKMFST